jgi:predicted transposase YdaD
VNTTKPWDDSMKWLVRQNPQSLVSFLLPDAVFTGEVDRELQAPAVTSDTLYKVTWQEKQVILHVEFQLKRDDDMGRRVWHYNALAYIHTKLPVHSVVIYLQEDKRPVESPFVVRLPDGRPTQRLDFETIKLWELDPHIFEQQGLAGLLPLLPLTKGGKNRETVTRMIEGLENAGRQDLFLVGFAVSWLVFTAEGDKEWLKARFSMMHDILKDTWVFQEVIKEGLGQGLEQGLQQGLQQGLEQGLQQGLEQGLEQGKQQELERVLLQFVEVRFPTLLTLAKWAVEQKVSLEQLEKKLNMLYRANTTEDATAALLANEEQE